jgi:uncharacterized alkaline shock family protein YloU
MARKLTGVVEIPEGAFSKLNSGKISEKELLKGAKVEMEHTKERKIAIAIALAHLDEMPDYYQRLAKMEREGKRKARQ